MPLLNGVRMILGTIPLLSAAITLHYFDWPLRSFGQVVALLLLVAIGPALVKALKNSARRI